MSHRRISELLLGILAVLVSTECSLAGTDLSRFPNDKSVQEAINRSIPADLDSSVAWTKMHADSLPSFITAFPYLPWDSIYVKEYPTLDYDSTRTTDVLLVYVSTGTDSASLQLYRRSPRGWELRSQDRLISPGKLMATDFYDLDRDKFNEMIVKLAIDSSPDFRWCIYSLKNDSLTDLTARLLPDLPNGQLVATSVGYSSWGGGELGVSRTEGADRDITASAVYYYNRTSGSFEGMDGDWHRRLPDSAHRKLDLSYLTCSDEIKELIQKYTPVALRDSFITQLTPNLYPGLIAPMYFHPRSDQPDDSLLLIMETASIFTGRSTLQLYRRVNSLWVFVNQNREIATEGLSNLSSEDIDCDGANELVLTSMVGARGNMEMDILGIQADTLAMLTPGLVGAVLSGRYIEVRHHAGCDWEIDVAEEDSSFNRQIGSHRIYQLDSLSHKYQFVREEKVPKE